MSSLTHWWRVTHICVSKLTIIGSDNGLSPGRRQAIIWTSDGILWIRPLGTNFSEILIEFLTFWFKKMRLNVSSTKWRPFCLGLNVLRLLLFQWANQADGKATIQGVNIWPFWWGIHWYHRRIPCTRGQWYRSCFSAMPPSWKGEIMALLSVSLRSMCQILCRKFWEQWGITGSRPSVRYVTSDRRTL